METYEESVNYCKEALKNCYWYSLGAVTGFKKNKTFEDIIVKGEILKNGQSIEIGKPFQDERIAVINKSKKGYYHTFPYSYLRDKYYESLVGKYFNSFREAWEAIH